MSDANDKKGIYERSEEIEMPKFSYQELDARTYSVDCCSPRKADEPHVKLAEIPSLRNLGRQ